MSLDTRRPVRPPPGRASWFESPYPTSIFPARRLRPGGGAPLAAERGFTLSGSAWHIPSPPFPLGACAQGAVPLSLLNAASPSVVRIGIRQLHHSGSALAPRGLCLLSPLNAASSLVVRLGVYHRHQSRSALAPRGVCAPLAAERCFTLGGSDWCIPSPLFPLGACAQGAVSPLAAE